jgi:hypothetical protein
MLLPSQHFKCDRFRRKNRTSAAETQDEVGIDGHSLGNGTAFSAVAPSQQPVCDAHRSNIREWFPQARITSRLTSGRFISSVPHAAFCCSNSHCPGVWRVCYIPLSKSLIYFDDFYVHNSGPRDDTPDRCAAPDPEAVAALSSHRGGGEPGRLAKSLELMANASTFIRG